MADFQLTWRGPAMLREIRRITCDRLKTVGEIQIEETKAAISHDCNGTKLEHSIAPMGPNRESGELYDSFDKPHLDRKNLEVTVSSDSQHALPLELGWQPIGHGDIPKVPARPFQRRVLARNTPRYAAILGAKMF